MFTMMTMEKQFQFRTNEGILSSLFYIFTFLLMTNFLPYGYEAPKSVSFYTKFEDGEKVKLRILPSGLEDRNCITGFEYFEETEDGKKTY